MFETPKRNAKYLSVTEAAAHFGVCPRTLVRLAARGVIPVVRLGRAIRFDVEAVAAALQASTTESTEVAAR